MKNRAARTRFSTNASFSIPATTRVALQTRAAAEPRTGTLGVDRIKRFLRSGDGDLPERYLSFMSRLANGERSNLYAPALRANPSWSISSIAFRFE